MAKKQNLLQNPEVQIKLDKAVEIVNEKKAHDPTLTDVRNFLGLKEVGSILESILETSSLQKPMKDYLKAVFIQRLPKKRALTKVFGRDLGYQEEALTDGIMHNAAVKEFLEIIKLFYVRVAPIAAVKEVEILLTGKHKDALAAAKAIKQGAGIIEESSKPPALPVSVIIQMPGSNPTQNVIEGEKKDA